MQYIALQYIAILLLFSIYKQEVVTINCNTIVDSLQYKLQLFSKLQLIYIAAGPLQYIARYN